MLPMDTKCEVVIPTRHQAVTLHKAEFFHGKAFTLCLRKCADVDYRREKHMKHSDVIRSGS